MGKKRERRKKCRRKRVHLPKHVVDSLKESTWTVPPIHAIQNRTSSAFCRPNQISTLSEGYKAMITTELLSEPGFDALANVSPRSANELLQIAGRISTNFRKIRMHRIANDHIPDAIKLSQSQAVKRPVTKTQLYATFQKFYDFVFPVEFLGAENSITLVQNFVNVFCDLRSRGDVTCYDELFQKIRLNQIEWLYGALHEVKVVLMRNILQYMTSLFTNFICRIFYTTVNSDGKIIHYKRSVWRRIERSGFQILCAQRKFNEVESISDDRPLHRLRFLPKIKTGGLRPIVTFKNENVTQQLSETRAVLDLIMEENRASLGWGAPNFLDWRIEKRKDENELYWATADVTNCFTIMDHSFLMKTLSQLIRNDKIFHVIRVSLMNEKLKYRYQKRVAGNSYVHAIRRVVLKRGETNANNTIGVVLTGEEVLKRIRDFALCTVTKRSGSNYVSGRGIAQGNTLSIRLCNIYLGAVERLLFPEKPREVFCQRYVDDYIMFSTNKEKLSQIIKKINSDGEQYGVHLNPNKIICSFDPAISGMKTLRPKEKITWCGFAFNTKTLSMSVDYRRYRLRRPTYNIDKSLHKSEYFNYMCFAAKRLLKNRYMSLRMCSQVFPEKRQLQLRRKFCRFAYEFYFRHFARQMHLNLHDRTIRVFFDQLVRWISNCFTYRSLPDAVSSELFK
ncbi:reverse transcriptase (RNA-dependent DNA polymerase) domain-containing protein [Ditylenchus destructor]|uniref:Telomerase reverse transcriptase n=1 Tax=Ditylenchus destructor TaxID=166010 RepID=A0AAD4N2D6_9BILA|nr:reverse transcriptase (RNA-dependent DNA polymerase) domain-containing protein [Ditylenchus destructor]